MRARLSRPQMITIRGLRTQEADVMGDAPVVVAKNRKVSFRMRAQIMWTGGLTGEAGTPGRDIFKRMVALIRNRDVPPSAPDDWRPITNDLVELASGAKLFIMDAQPAFPRKISIRTPDGGWDGWRLILTDRQSTMQAATQYES